VSERTSEQAQGSAESKGVCVRERLKKRETKRQEKRHSARENERARKVAHG